MNDEEFTMVALSIMLAGQGLIWGVIGFGVAWLMYA